MHTTLERIWLRKANQSCIFGKQPMIPIILHVYLSYLSSFVKFSTLVQSSEVLPWIFSETLTELNKLKHRFGGMPHDRDLQGAAKALIRLRSTYKFDLEHFSHGNIHGLQTGAQLTTKDSFFLGKFAFSNGNFAEAQRWLEFAAWQVAADTDEASNHTTSNNGGVSSDQVDSFLRDVR